MKNPLRSALITALLIFSAASFAESPPGSVPAPAPGATHPCKAIDAACQAAGFVPRGFRNGKGLWKDCVKPIMSGQTVNGVSVSADEVAACKAKRGAKAQ